VVHDRTVEILIAAITVVVAGALIAWFVFTPHHPENGASHSDDHPETLSQRFYGRNPPGPAGPDAESQRPEDTGNAWDPPPPVAAVVRANEDAP
jgi:hypothetical protein